MLNKLILTLLILTLLSSTLSAQTKVGTTGPTFFDLFTSVTSKGMGETGIAVLSQNSFFNNPANLGLLINAKSGSISFYPKKIKVGPNEDYFNGSISFPIIRKQNSEWHRYFGIAYYYGEFGTIKPQVEIDYSMDPAGVTRVFTFKEVMHNLVLSAALTNSNFDVSWGVTIKYYKESVVDNSFDGYSFEFGSTFRYKLLTVNDEKYSLFLFPAFGAVIKNFGPDMKGFTSEIPLPKTNNYGLSIETGIGKKMSDDNSVNLIAITPAIEFQEDRYDNWKTNYGLDVSLCELFNARFGIITEGYLNYNEYTFGYSLSTKQLGKFIKIVTENDQEPKNRLINFFTNDLDIAYHYASYDTLYGEPYHEIIVSYNLGK